MIEAIVEAVETFVNYIEEISVNETVLQDVGELLDKACETENAVIGIESSTEEVQCLEANATFIKDGHRYVTDDNGKIIRRDNELIPNNTYELNGYKYKTDEMGRIISAEGKAHLRKREGRQTIKDSKEIIGRGDELPSDDRGHLIGDQLDGSNGMENIVSQDAGINKGDYKRLEDTIRKKIEDGHDVNIKVEPIYGIKGSYRPTDIKYTHIIDGEKNITLFPNGR